MTVRLAIASAALAAFLSNGCTSSAAVGVSSLVIAAHDGGTLVVSNPTTTAITIKGSVVVEGSDGKTWKPLITEMSLVGSCPIDGIAMPVATITLKPKQTLNPPPWRGWSCSGQCETHCRSNMYWGSGPFRFRLTDIAGAAIVSGSFGMPRQPAH